MRRLIYLMNVSLDGFAATPDGGVDWTSIDEELLTWFNDQTRGTQAFLYGTRLYELMASYWPTAESDLGATPAMLDFARLWVRMPKVVFSRSLPTVAWNSRLANGDIEAELARLRTEFDGEVSVGGPTLAAAFIRRGLVDEYRLVVHPVVLGAGLPFLPALDQALDLELIDTRRFASGAIYLAYAARRLDIVSR